MKENEYTHKPLLTKREREVFELLVQDKTTKEIAGELFISEKTVRNHISNAMQKLGVKGAFPSCHRAPSYGRVKVIIGERYPKSNSVYPRNPKSRINIKTLF